MVAILGPRQVGKTSIARSLAAAHEEGATFFDLENPVAVARLAEPMLVLEPLRGLVVLDEIQRRPELFPILRVLADRPGKPARFLVLGSASPELLRQTSETLAGRIHFHDLGGFTLDETGPGTMDRLWLRGGFPLSFLADSEDASFDWRRDFIRTFLERDLPQLGVQTPGETLRRFWTMLAHVHGQLWNGSEFSRSFGVSTPTVQRYLDLLTSTFVVHQLRPWFENLGKRQVKSPKVYLSDSGLVHALLGITDREDLESHPRLGASWEGFAIREIVERLGAHPEEAFFWSTHGGAELDLLVIRGRRRLGFEIKRTDAPKVTPSMRIALNDLKLDRLDVIHAGEFAFPMTEGIRAIPLAKIWELLDPL
ncbi:MAG: ATP-binding protein [Acidobacteriota bacterium]